LYIVFGAYLINSVFEFYPIPDVLSDLDKWAVAIGGVLIIFGGFHFLRPPKKE
tara:strand:+ start:628 stop:786 length:159 start_codon:yes stop_codon:yes gene_type:complete